MISAEETVAREILASAKGLLDRASADTRGLWPRAAVLLERQALEVALKTYWSAKAPGVEECSTRAQFLCLGTYLSDEPVARRAHQVFGANRFHDVIERRPTDGTKPLQIGLVSKRYVLVQHASVVEAVTAEVTRTGIDPAQVPVHLLITEYGTRIARRATLPEDHAFTPDDGHSMGLTFECFNSVDRTVPLFAAVGWFRFVCSNGLVVGTTSAKVRQRHSPPLEIDEVSQVLAEGMESALQDRQSFATWRSTKIPRRDLEKWVDGPVADAWGPLAAARVYGILTTGVDGRPVPPFKRVAPHRWQRTGGPQVPGTHAPCGDGYEIAQVLAWVAAQRADVAERLRWREQIRSLMSHLLQ